VAVLVGALGGEEKGFDPYNRDTVLLKSTVFSLSRQQNTKDIDKYVKGIKI
jgi:hypothetical protein